jgi:hypothetical protein
MAYVTNGETTIKTSNPENFNEGWTRLSEKEGKARYIAEFETDLRDMLENNPNVYTILRHVSTSGMKRAIDLIVIDEGKPRNISYAASIVMGWRMDGKHGGIVANGCGTDMGFSLVNNLSMRLYCPEKYDHDSAYRLKHHWL